MWTRIQCGKEAWGLLKHWNISLEWCKTRDTSHICCIKKTLERTWQKQLVKLPRCLIPELVCLTILPYPSWSCHASPSSGFLHSFAIQIPSPGFLSSAVLSALLAAALVTMQEFLESLLDQVFLFIYLLCSWQGSPGLLLCFFSPQGTRS